MAVPPAWESWPISSTPRSSLTPNNSTLKHHHPRQLRWERRTRVRQISPLSVSLPSSKTDLRPCSFLPAFHGHHLSFNSSSPSSSLSFSQLLSQILATPTPTAAPAAPPPLHRARSSTHSLRHAGSRSRLNDSYVAEPAALPLSPTFNPPHSRTATGSSSGIESVSTGVTSLHGGGDGKAAGLVLVRVAKPDTDAFRAYGSMIPEFLRLEEMVAKGWVRQ